jgi:GPH family glycoside/pentoside/hexuronide:cation symporter
MGVMVAVTLCCYPLVNYLEKKYSKKKMMIVAFMALGVVFAGIWHLGRYPVSPVVQVIVLMVSFGLFDSFLGILPNTVVADIAEQDSKLSGQNREAMFFGMRALFQKIGQTLGIMIFAMLTLWGKDPGNDLGLRMSGAAGAVLCFFAAWVYGRYRE